MPTLNPTIARDVTLIEAAPTTNFGTGICAVSSNVGDLQHAILDFGSIAAIPAGSTITGADLVYDVTTVVEAASGGTTLAAYVLTNTGSWVENTATWQTVDGVVEWDVYGGDRDLTNGKTSGLTWPGTTGSKTASIISTIQRILDTQPTKCQILLAATTEAGSFRGQFQFQHRGVSGATLAITYTGYPPRLSADRLSTSRLSSDRLSLSRLA